MRECSELVERAAKTMATTLVRGETGSGKEVAARAIHETGLRADGPFVVVNCAALPDSLLESELFGYEKGAFTGATGRKPGRVELAEGGTLFLDEIGDVSPAVQAKLLRLVQEKEYQPLGSTRTCQADVRFIAATHRDLEQMVEDGSFREDLFYRLNVIPIRMPSLRERQADIPMLAHHFITRQASENRRAGMTLTDAAATRLSEQPWPGNVRQLMNFVERLVVFSDGEVVRLQDVQRELARAGRYGGRSESAADASLGRAPAPRHRGGSSSTTSTSLRDARRDAEKWALLDALDRAGENRSHAARMLGISRRTIYALLSTHGIT